MHRGRLRWIALTGAVLVGASFLLSPDGTPQETRSVEVVRVRDADANHARVQPPEPRTCPGIPQPLRLLVIGDSLTFQAKEAAEAVAARYEGVLVLRIVGLPGTGLISGFDWHEAMRRLVEDFHPHVVIAEFIGNYFPPYLQDARGVDILPGTEAFYERWQTATMAAMDVLTAEGALVFWVLGPNLADATADTQRRRIDAIYRSLSSCYGSVEFIDCYRIISPDGYTSTLVNRLGETEIVREPDGVHLTPAGVQRLVEAAETAIVARLEQREWPHCLPFETDRAAPVAPPAGL